MTRSAATGDELLEAFRSFPPTFAVAATAAEDEPVPAGEWIRRDRPPPDRRRARGPSGSRLAQAARQDDPHWPWTEPGLAPGFEEATLLTVLTVFARRRAKTVATVRALDEAGWARFRTHATYGRLDVAGLLRLASNHDEEHLASLVDTEEP